MILILRYPVSATIVFQVMGTQKTSFSTNDIIIFTNVTMNQGSGYSRTTGKFTAPLSGLYLFVKQICSGGGNYAYTQFVYNNNMVLRSSTSSSYNQCASAQIYLHLSKGDQVWVKLTSTAGSIYSYHDSGTTNFAGALINV